MARSTAKRRAKSKAVEAGQKTRHSGPIGRLRAYLKVLGPGLVTGASDDDPSGIGTYAQTGAQFGYAQLWMALFSLPLMTAIQEICVRIAMQTGEGLADAIRKNYPKPILHACLGLLFIANTINIAADLGAMAAAGQLLAPLPFAVWLVAFSLIITALIVFVSYHRYAQVLRFLCLSLLAYVVVVFAVRQDWALALRSTLIPTVRLQRDYLLNLVAILGTTISPYLFFWQAGQEIEEEIDEGKTSEWSRRGVSHAELKGRRADVGTGMLFSNLVMWFIIATTASTLFRHGITNIDSAAKAAEALRPVAGRLASLLFSLGIIGTGLLAVPVLAGSSAYAAAETFSMRHGLALKLRQAPGFYAIIIVTTLVGVAMNFLGLNPMKALVYAAVINGLIAPPLLVMIMLIGGNRRIMKQRVNGRLSSTVGWLTTVTMGAAALGLIASFVIR